MGIEMKTVFPWEIGKVINTNLAAYGPDGWKWSSEISSDDLEILDVAEGSMIVRGWHAPRNSDIVVRVDLTDGSTAEIRSHG